MAGADRRKVPETRLCRWAAMTELEAPALGACDLLALSGRGELARHVARVMRETSLTAVGTRIAGVDIAGRRTPL